MGVMDSTAQTLRAIEEDKAVAALFALNPDPRWIGRIRAEAYKASARTGLSVLVVLLAMSTRVSEGHPHDHVLDWLKKL